MIAILTILAIIILGGYCAAWIMCTIIDDISKEETLTMCDVCRQSPCDPRCPNAPEPEAVYKCRNCGRRLIMIKREVKKYAVCTANIQALFPNDDVTCKWCKFFSHIKNRCLLTDEPIVDAHRCVGSECPLEIVEESR